MAKKSQELVALIRNVQHEQEKFFASLPEPERTANGTWQVWAPKDVLAHFTFWQNSLLDTFDNLNHPPAEQEPFEVRNHKNYLNNASRPYSDIESDYRKSLDRVLERTATFSDADLSEPRRFPRITQNLQQDSPLSGTILGNTYSHAITHLAELVGKRGDKARARELQETGTQKLIEYDPSPNTKGTALYNLACGMALSGDPPRAIELLREAFPLRPDLVEFSKQDTDFDDVRALPEFQALYN